MAADGHREWLLAFGEGFFSREPVEGDRLERPAVVPCHEAVGRVVWLLTVTPNRRSTILVFSAY